MENERKNIVVIFLYKIKKNKDKSIKKNYIKFQYINIKIEIKKKIWREMKDKEKRKGQLQLVTTPILSENIN